MIWLFIQLIQLLAKYYQTRLKKLNILLGETAKFKLIAQRSIF